MTRTTRVLSNRDLAPTRWVTLDGGPIIKTPARFGQHFRVILTENASLEPPLEGTDGQRIVWRFQQPLEGGITVTPNTGGFVVRGDLPAVDPGASAVTLWEALYDAQSGFWDLRGVPDLSSLYDAAGAAQDVADDLAAHEADSGDPHAAAGYLTETDADALYDPIGAAAAAYAAAYADAKADAWPIGCVFIAVVPTDPATLLGFGVWEYIGAGRTFVGVDTGDADFNTVEKTGGAKTHTHGAGSYAVDDHAAHTHSVTSNVTVSNHPPNVTDVNSGSGVAIGAGTTDAAPDAHTHSTPELSHSVTNNAVTSDNPSATLSHSFSGTSAAGSTLMPYFTIYAWKRIEPPS